MRDHKTILIILFEGCQLLDLAGPASVFANAGRCQAAMRYDLRYASLQGGLVLTETGLPVMTEALPPISGADIDTIIVAGGPGRALKTAMVDTALINWLGREAGHARRLASVCSGAFILAETGMLSGLDVTTHWVACDRLQGRYPDLQVQEAALFIQQDRIWTSAGVSTGIDMALAMVEDDLGRDTSHKIARNLVLYSRRPGHQSQFSDVLHHQASSGNRFAGLMEWADANLQEDLTIDHLAMRAGLSTRQFYRLFKQETGSSPATMLRQMRLNRARELLLAGMPVKRIATQTGFSSAANLGTAFKARFGLTPALYRDMHGGGAIDPGDAPPENCLVTE